MAVGCLRAHATAFLQALAVTRAVDQCAREFTAAPPFRECETQSAMGAVRGGSGLGCVTRRVHRDRLAAQHFPVPVEVRRDNRIPRPELWAPHRIGDGRRQLEAAVSKLADEILDRTPLLIAQDDVAASIELRVSFRTRDRPIHVVAAHGCTRRAISPFTSTAVMRIVSSASSAASSPKTRRIMRASAGLHRL